MNIRLGIVFAAGLAMLPCTVYGQALSPEQKVKVDAKARQLAAWGSDPAIVSAVKAFNSAPPAETQGMTQERWASLTLLDPVVRALSKNQLATYLKSKKDDSISEIFVSGAGGTKVAFLSKTTSWSHKGKAKHDLPMAGKTWVGPLDVDESSGALQVQVAFPVVDGGKPIGSIVIGLKASAL